MPVCPLLYVNKYTMRPCEDWLSEGSNDLASAAPAVLSCLIPYASP